jgi:ATP-binding cassette subfamily F protein 2
MIRVVFAILAMEHPHVILLDEPTNHLDMESIDSLAKAIKEFSGGVVIVSHDFRMSLSYLVSDHELH